MELHEKECERITKENKTNDYFNGGNKFVRYRFELEEFLWKELNSSERDLFRFLVFECFRHNKNFIGSSMHITIKRDYICEKMGISTFKFNNALEGLIKKELIITKRRHRRAPNTYIIIPPRDMI